MINTTKSKKKVKIAFFINAIHINGGAERVLTILANFLTANFEVIIITKSKGSPYYNLNQDIKIINLLDKFNPSDNYGKSFSINFVFVRKLIRTLKEEKVNLLITFMTTTNIIGIISGLYTRIPVIISERNNPKKQNINRVWKFLRKLLYGFSNALVVQTEEIKSFFKNFVAIKKTYIVPNPISPDFYFVNSNVNKENIILSVGSLSEQKSQKTIIKAFSLIENLNWKLIIAGEGILRKELELLISELNLKDKVFLPGKTKEIAELYQKSKIFCFSSLYEGFPNALIEAMHFKLACISTDCPTGPSQLIENGVNGYLVEINNIKEMSQKMELLIRDEEKRNNFGVKSSIIVSKFNIESVGNQWLELINRILKTN